VPLRGYNRDVTVGRKTADGSIGLEVLEFQATTPWE
jgi:hypothetical protein